MKKTLVLGASVKPERYAYKACSMLLNYGHPIVPVGLKKGEVFGHEIITDHRLVGEIDTLTLYVGPRNQAYWQDYILDIKPKRLIFNPGTENNSLAEKLRAKGIETVEACTLVMLTLGHY